MTSALRHSPALEARELLEVIDDRYERRSTVVCSQLPLGEWHRAITDPTLADAILDRLVHGAHKFTLSGESMRKKKGGMAAKARRGRSYTLRTENRRCVACGSGWPN